MDMEVWLESIGFDAENTVKQYFHLLTAPWTVNKYVLRMILSNIDSSDLVEIIAFTDLTRWELFKNAPVAPNVSVACAKAFTKYIFERAGVDYE